MRRIAVWLLSTLAALTLLFSYHTSTYATAAATAVQADSAVVQAAAEAPRTATTVRSTRSAASASGGGSGADPVSGAGASGTGTGSAASSSAGTAGGTFTGTAASTPYGPVQVQVTVSGGRVTSVQAISYPYSSGRDRAINSRAIPVLDQEATSSQGRSVSAVSGASYTSAAYATSLQAALDEANA